MISSRAVIDDDDGAAVDAPAPQLGRPQRDLALDERLRAGVERGADMGLAAVARAEQERGVRRLARHPAQPLGGRRRGGLLERARGVGAREHAGTGELAEDRVAPRPQPGGVRGPRGVAGRALRHGEQGRDLERREVLRAVAEVRPRRGLDALDVAAVRRAPEVRLEDLALAEPQIELHGAEHVDDLAAEGARPRLEQPRELHGQGRAAGDATAGDDVAPRARARSRAGPRRRGARTAGPRARRAPRRSGGRRGRAPRGGATCRRARGRRTRAARRGTRRRPTAPRRARAAAPRARARAPPASARCRP